MDFRGIPPMVMNGNLAENWKFWKQRFITYLKATEIAKKDESTKCAQLLTLIGDEGIRIYNTFIWSEEETLELLQAKFDNHFNPKKNLTYERHKFFTYRQLEDQTVDQFIIELKNLSLSCEFENLREALVKDMLVCGLRSTYIREKLLQEDVPTLEKAVQICVNLENTKHQSKLISNGLNHEKTEVDAISSKHSRHHNSYSPRFQPSRPTYHPSMSNGRSKPACQKCARHHGFRNCPAFGKKCQNCGLLNHFSSCCKNKNNSFNNNHKTNSKFKNKRKHVNFLDKDDSSIDNIDIQDSFLFVGSIDCFRRVSVPADSGEIAAVSETSWVTELEIQDQRLDFKLDTGAMANIIPVSFLKNINFDFSKINKTSVKLTSYTKHNIPVIGQCILNCKFRGKQVSLLFCVVSIDSFPILGLKACVELELIKKIDSLDGEISKKELLLKNIQKKYQTVFSGMGCLKKEHHIELKVGAKPIVNYPRKVPFAIRDKLKFTLNELEKQGLIERSDDCTDWCHNMVIVRKPNGQLRIALDPKDLNLNIKRHFFQIPTLEELTSKLSGSKYFSVLDATQGFLQIKLDKESSKLCTFATPFGRYRFLRLPYGICSAPEVFQEAMYEMFGNIEGCTFYIDDLLIFGNSIEEHNARLEKVLSIAEKNNLKFNKGKCKLLLSEVKYMGHIISPKGIKPDFDKIQAIKDMPPPKDKKGLQRFLGMVTYMCKFIENLSEKTASLRILLKKDSVFCWSDVQAKAFNNLKNILSSAPCLEYYDVNKQSAVISVDSSQYGMAAVLLQDDRPCAHASKALTEVQCRYSQIEKEMLAVWFGISRFSQFVFGIKSLTVETDHLPLVSIVKKPLHLCPPRLQRMLIQLRKYNFELVYKPGKKLILADTLSRAFCKNNFFDENIDIELEAQICLALMSINATPSKKQEIRVLTKADPELILLLDLVRNGWPHRVKDCPENVKYYFKFRGEISESEGLLFKGQNLIVPKALRNDILNKLHYSHLSAKKCYENAKLSFFWPGMKKQIEDYVMSCHVCQTFQKSQHPEPLISHDIVLRPWYKAGADIFHLFGQSYLLIVDYYSKYVEVLNLNKDLTSNNVIHKLKSVFSRFGIPNVLFTDNGPEFSSLIFKKFSKTWDFVHKTSSPLYAQSNGQVERAIQTVKNLLKKCALDKKDPYLALLELRNMPLDKTNSPANALFNRNIRSILPQLNKKFHNKQFSKNKFNKFIINNQRKQKQNFDKKSHIKLKDLPKNCLVFVQVKPKSNWIRGKIKEKVDVRSYLVETETGQILRRNRKFIKEIRHQLRESTRSYSRNLKFNNFQSYENLQHFNYIPVCNNNSLDDDMVENQNLRDTSSSNLDENISVRSGVSVNSSSSSNYSYFNESQEDLYGDIGSGQSSTSFKSLCSPSEVTTPTDEQKRDSVCKPSMTRSSKSGRIIKYPKKLLDYHSY